MFSRCTVPPLISPSAGPVGTFVSLNGLNLSAKADYETIAVLIDGVAVPFFLFGEPLTLPMIILQIPSLQPITTVVSVFEKRKCSRQILPTYFFFTILPAPPTFAVPLPQPPPPPPTPPPPPVLSITDVSPNSGLTNTTVTVTGTAFVSGITVTIGGITVDPSLVTFISDTEITFVVPLELPASINAYPITVTNPISSGGDSVTSEPPNTYTVVGTQACSLLTNPLLQFGVLAGTEVKSVGESNVVAASGGNDIGVFPGTTISGFPPGTGGTLHPGDLTAETAQTQAIALYDSLAALVPTASLGQDLSGQNLFPGVYNITGDAFVSEGASLFLRSEGKVNEKFIFQISGNLTMESQSSVTLFGIQSCNVFWQVASSATIGTNVIFAGQIVALDSITVGNVSLLDGRLFARNGSVNLDEDIITIGTCPTCP